MHASGRTEAPRLALVHSLALDCSVWDGVVAELAAEVDLLTVDARGHGASTKSAGPFTTAQFAGDLADVLRAAGWERAIVAGARGISVRWEVMRSKALIPQSPRGPAFPASASCHGSTSNRAMVS